MYVKICGLRSTGDVTAAVDAGADAVGFVLTSSVRQVAPERARKLAAGVPDHVLTVAVFTDEPCDVIRAAAHAAGVRAIQLHGPRARTDFAALRHMPGCLIRATASEAPDLNPGAYGEDMLIVDALRPGSGQPWRWGALADRGFTGRWLLAGGLNERNVADAVRAARPWGVDVSSGVEGDRGVKDPALIRRFIAAAKTAR
ncbi:MAG TPA: phosphoribosylanthranilate isomerase [Pilimelia sp.]|nr:phosphoribosylanthranilate isomerase [Pilimelia sp.]